MGKVTKTAAAVAAAAAIGGGIALYTSTDTAQPETPAAYVDDVQPVTVVLPKITIPAAPAATVSTPEINSFRLVASCDLEALGVPEAQAATVQVRDLPDPAADIPALIAIRRELQPLIRDKRTLLSATIRADDPVWRKWIAIYNDAEYRDYVPEYKPLEPGLRIINEVKCPADTDEFATMQTRLDYYAGRGYNAVLVTFDTTESLARLCSAVDYIKSAGFRVVIAYAGRENLSEPVFRDPARIRAFLAALGGKADALLLGWRRTSLHLFLPDQTFTNFLIRAARSGNPELPFIGMAYFGETAETMQGITCHVPENASAVLVIGLGYPRASTKKALQKLFPEVAGHPHKIGLVVGEKPYFDTSNNTGKSAAENDAMKRRIEIRLQQAGFASTMTYSGDGSDGQYGDKTRTENLCREYGTK